MLLNISMTLISGLILAGCCSPFFSSCVTPAEQSGKPVGTSKVYLLPNAANESDYKTDPVIESIKSDKAAKDFIEGECMKSRQSYPVNKAEKALISGTIAAAASLSISAITHYYNYRLDKSKQELEEFKKGAIKSYSNRIFLKGEDLATSSCILLYRKQKDSETAGLLSILALKSKGSNAFSFEPIYVKAVDTSALTIKDKKPPKIDVSFALSTKSIIPDIVTKAPKLVDLGSGVTTVTGVVLSESKVSCVHPDTTISECSSSDLIPQLNSDQLVSLTVAVTESGQDGKVLDQRIGQISALKEAVGPSIKDAFGKLSFDE